MYCISVNYKNSDVNIRKKLAFSENVQKEFLTELINGKTVSECVILCTCNRTELYFCGNEDSLNTVQNLLSNYSGIECDLLKKHLYLFYSDKAVMHLFRVVSGIESMVIGEDEILGQITTSDIPIVFKGGLITKLILNESGLSSVQRTTKDIDANWIGQPPSMDYLVDSLNNSFGDLQRCYKAVASRQYGEKQSAGISVIDKNTGRKFITMDIDIKPLIDSKTYYYEQTKIRGVLPNEILADKICVLSGEAIYKNRAKDVLDVFLLSKCVKVYSKDISDICKRAGREIKSFDAFHNKKAEIEHAYNKLKGIEGKPDFNTVYNYLYEFIVPFAQEVIPNKMWDCKSLSWNDVCKTKSPLSRKQINQNAKIISRTQENQSQHNKDKNKGI